MSALRNNRALATRLVMGPAVIAAVFFFLEKERPFTEVWKPLLIYVVIAVPAFFLLDKLRRGSRA